MIFLINIPSGRGAPWSPMDSWISPPRSFRWWDSFSPACVFVVWWEGMLRYYVIVCIVHSIILNHILSGIEAKNPWVSLSIEYQLYGCTVVLMDVLLWWWHVPAAEVQGLGCRSHRSTLAVGPWLVPSMAVGGWVKPCGPCLTSI